MRQVSIKRHIAAPPRAVWRVLTDAEALVNAGAGLTSISGKIAANAAFAIKTDLAPNRDFKIRVTEFAPPKRMDWQSGQWPIFLGRRVFLLAPDDGGTQFEMTETFSGLLLPLIWRAMPDLQPSFETFAAALARLTEGETP